MITQLSLRNYRSLGGWAEIPLDPLTVLVGRNGAGKSNVADALRFVGDAVRDGLEHAVASRQGFGSLRRWSRGGPFDVTLLLNVRLGAVDWFWGIELTTDRTTEFRVKREVASASATPARVAMLAELKEAFIWGPLDAKPDPEIGWEESALGSYDFHQGTWKTLPRPDLKLTPAPRSLVLPQLAKLDPRRTQQAVLHQRPPSGGGPPGRGP